jgi:hypothetical protein
MNDETAPGQYKAQEGTWELRAPDGTSWHESSPMACLRAEMRDRIPAKVALARIFDNLEAEGSATDHEPAAAPEPLTDEQIERKVLSALAAIGRHDAWDALTYASGPYEISKVKEWGLRLARALATQPGTPNKGKS